MMAYVGQKNGVEDIQYLDTGTMEGRSEAQRLIEQGYRPRPLTQNEVAIQGEGGDEGITSSEETFILTDSALLDRIANGTATPEEERRLGILLARDRQQRGDVVAQTGEYVPFPDKPLPALCTTSFGTKSSKR